MRGAGVGGVELTERLVDVERAAERLLGCDASSRSRGNRRSIRLTLTCAPGASVGSRLTQQPRQHSRRHIGQYELGVHP